MKNNIYIPKHLYAAATTILLLLSPTHLPAKETLPEITYSNLQVRFNPKTNSVELTFEGNLPLPNLGYSITISPRLTKNGQEAHQSRTSLAKLHAEEMEGDWYQLSRLRKERAGKQHLSLSRAQRIIPTNKYSYKTNISQNEWIDDVSVTVYTTLRTYSGVVSEQIFRFKDLLSFKPDFEEPNDIPTLKTQATARRFVERISDINRTIATGKADIQSIENYIESDGDGSLTVYFEVGSSQVNPSYLWNEGTLDELINTVNEMKHNSHDPRIVIVGYSSPEGSPEVNKRLSMDRALSIRQYITDNSQMRSSEIIPYEGGINWIGLQRLVAADNSIAYRDEILPILELPIWDARTQTGRHGELMRLRGGDPYRYLLNNFFPQLRGAAFIKVFYNDNENNRTY